MSPDDYLRLPFSPDQRQSFKDQVAYLEKSFHSFRWLVDGVSESDAIQALYIELLEAFSSRLDASGLPPDEYDKHIYEFVTKNFPLLLDEIITRGLPDGDQAENITELVLLRSWIFHSAQELLIIAEKFAHGYPGNQHGPGYDPTPDKRAKRPPDRDDLYKRFLNKCEKVLGRRPSQNEIARWAAYQDRTQFTRWRRGTDDTGDGSAADRNFRNLFNTSEEDLADRVKKVEAIHTSTTRQKESLN